MSWDIAIMDLPADAKSLGDIPQDFVPRTLGPRAALISKILDIAPSADFSDPTWGELTTPDFVVEFSMGREDPVASVMLHVRGGDVVVGFISALLQNLGLRAIDCSEGAFFEPSTSAQSLAAWRDFRDRAIHGR